MLRLQQPHQQVQVVEGDRLARRGAQQLSVQGNAPRSRVINDSCTGPLDAQYKVTVLDQVANATVPCDPPIRNIP